MLIVLEGLDGIGKTTQTHLLMEYFEKQGYDCEFLHFPRVQTSPFGPLIQKYLQGDFGSLKEVHPYLSASLYAIDQYLAFRDVADKSGKKIIFLDRYYYSNLAYQSSRLTPMEQEAFMAWLEDVIASFHLPDPDFALYMYGSSQEFRKANLEKRETQDLHEQDQYYQCGVHQKYLEMCDNRWKNLRPYDCSDPAGQVRGIDEIHQDLITLVQEKIH